MKNKKIKIIGIVLLIFSLIGIFLYIKKQYEIKSGGTQMSGYVLGKGIAPDLTPEEIKALLQKEVDKSKVSFSIYSDLTFKGKKGIIMFANPRYSAHNIDLSVVVDGKTIIRTEKISPDQYIEEIELIGKPLKKGKHEGQAWIKAYDRKTDEVVGEVTVDLNITSK